MIYQNLFQVIQYQNIIILMVSQNVYDLVIHLHLDFQISNNL